jgi:hypothetical protein
LTMVSAGWVGMGRCQRAGNSTLPRAGGRAGEVEVAPAGAWPSRSAVSGGGRRWSGAEGIHSGSRLEVDAS